MILNSLKSIGCRAFNDCSKLAEATILGTIKEINKTLFFKCSSLEKLAYNFTISFKTRKWRIWAEQITWSVFNSTAIWNDYYFMLCRMWKIEINNNSFKKIDKCAFKNWMTFHYILEWIEKAFYKCSSLIYIKIPLSLKTICNNACVAID